jgi:N-acetylmuramoyl-L-alanine amidase
MKIISAVGTSFLFLFLTLALSFSGCSKKEIGSGYVYHGSIDLTQHAHLVGKKIFIDPGHGARGSFDGRKGPGGLREEEVNLRVGLILRSMFTAAGAEVKIVREKDVDISLEERVKMAKEYKPDVFVSIHHNGSARPVDKGLNFASILLWGNRDNNPASYDLGEKLFTETKKVIPNCNFVSDYSVFRETGAYVLRETGELCPGVLGEFGFFSDKIHEAKLKTEEYNITEAECYFNAVSDFFKRGVPTAVFVTDQKVHDPKGQLGVGVRNPRFWVKLSPDCPQNDILPGSLKVTLNGRTVTTQRTGKNLYQINYGSAVFGGGSRFRVTYKNANGRSSMLLTAAFAVGFMRGEFDANLSEGAILADTNPSKALEILLPEIYSGFTDPKCDAITYHAARAFDRLGDKPMASYYYTSLYQYFPDSPLIKSIPSDYLKTRFVPSDFYGIPTQWERM